MEDQRPNSAKGDRLKGLRGNTFKDKPERINKNGRPRKWVSTLKAQGYTISEINDGIQAILAMTQDELEEVHKKAKDVTVLEANIASAIRKDIAKGEFKTIEMLLSRRFGSPKQDVSLDGSMEIKLTRRIVK